MLFNNNMIDNIYNSDIDNKIRLIEKNNIIKKMNDNTFLNQFDTLKFDNNSEPVSIIESNKGKNIFLERDLDFQRGYSQFELNNTHYDIFSPEDFTHNNMTPNTNRRDTYTNYTIPQRTLELFTGVSDTYVSKQEKVPLFDPLADLTWVNGMPSVSGVLKNRYLPSNKNNNGNLPFDSKVRVKPGVDNINQEGTYSVYRVNPQTVDTLRSQINQKVSYNNVIKQVIKKGEKRAPDPNLTKYKLPDFRETTFDKLIPTKSQFDKGQVYGEYTNTDTMRNLTQHYQPGPKVNINQGPDKDKTKFEPSKRESYNNDPTHAVYSVNVKPVMTNIKSCTNYDNQRTTTNYQQQGIISNNTTTYHVDYKDIPLTTMRELLIHNDNINNISSVQKQNYVFSNDMVLPITHRQTNNNQDVLGPNSNIQLPQLYNNDLAKSTIKESSSHNIVSNTVSLINQPQLYNNDLAKSTIKETSSHNIVSNTVSLINQPKLYNNDLAKSTIKETSSHNIVSNAMSLINQAQLYNNDLAKPTIKSSSHNIVSNTISLINQPQLYNNDLAKSTIKETSSHNIVSNAMSLINQPQLYNNNLAKPTIKSSSHNIVSNAVSLINQPQLYNNDLAKSTIKETSSHNIVSNTISLINQPQLYNNDLAKLTTKETTLYENMGNIGNNTISYIKDNNDIAKSTIKEGTIYNNYQSNINNEGSTYVISYKDILRPTIKETTIDNTYIGNIDSGHNAGYVHDDNDKTRTTIKELTIDNNYIGNLNNTNNNIYINSKDLNMKPTIKQTVIFEKDGFINNNTSSYIKNNDIMKPTIKETTIDNTYDGGVVGNTINYVKNNDNLRTTIKETTILENYTGCLHNDVSKQISHLAPNNMTIDERREISTKGRTPGGKKDLNGPYIDKNNVRLINPILFSYVSAPHIGLDNNIMPSVRLHNNKKPIIETDNTSYHINQNLKETLKHNPYVIN